jgi:hypothetical protein
MQLLQILVCIFLVVLITYEKYLYWKNHFLTISTSNLSYHNDGQSCGADMRPLSLCSRHAFSHNDPLPKWRGEHADAPYLRKRNKKIFAWGF